jgi:hypothetical protein
MERVDAFGVKLDKGDRSAMKTAHSAFFKGGLDIRFKLREQSFRKYPSLRELLSSVDPVDDEPKSFLASEERFRLVQRMQRENRIIAVVGDFAGSTAMPAIARHLSDEKLQVGAFYVSNVEQYLLTDGVWHRWQENIAALPAHPRSVFVRAYLDQGKKHPRQLDGHRTATVLQRITAFKKRKNYPSMLALSTHELLAGP